jgi:hypothetical protein
VFGYGLGNGVAVGFKDGEAVAESGELGIRGGGTGGRRGAADQHGEGEDGQELFHTPVLAGTAGLSIHRTNRAAPCRRARPVENSGAWKLYPIPGRLKNGSDWPMPTRRASASCALPSQSVLRATNCIRVQDRAVG